jgi:hypothetical protein
MESRSTRAPSPQISAKQRRRSRLLPVLAIAIAAVAAVAAYITFRPGVDSSGTTSTVPSTRPASAQPTQEERKEIDDLLALTSSTASGAPDATLIRTGADTYPNGTVTGWIVDGRHTIWLGSDSSGQPVVVRMQSASAGKDLQVSESPAGGEEPLSDGQARDFALAAARSGYPDFKGDYVRPIPRSEVDTPGDAGGRSYVYTWQYLDEVADGTEVSLPKWVTVWVDKSTGEVTGYDSLEMAASSTKELKPEFKGEEAAQQAILDSTWSGSGLKSDQCQTTLLLVPVRHGAAWGPPELVWKVVPAAGDEAEYVADGSGEVLDETRLYLPALEPDWREPLFDSVP